jgi:hypothetical protein
MKKELLPNLFILLALVLGLGLALPKYSYAALCIGGTVTSDSNYEYHTFSTAESDTFGCTSNLTVSVEVWGAGGGGGANSSSDFYCGGGGGGGAYAKKNSIAITSGTIYPVYVGTLGSGGVAPSGNGGTGEDSYFINSSTVMAKGGGGGSHNGVHGHGGLGSSSVGDTKYSGGSGKSDLVGTEAGGGGGSGGTGSAGNEATSSTGAWAVTGGGPGGHGATSEGAGSAPSSGYGGGGGGALSTLSGGKNGGAGYQGKVVITVPIPTCFPSSPISMGGVYTLSSSCSVGAVEGLITGIEDNNSSATDASNSAALVIDGATLTVGSANNQTVLFGQIVLKNNASIVIAKEAGAQLVKGVRWVKDTDTDTYPDTANQTPSVGTRPDSTYVRRNYALANLASTDCAINDANKWRNGYIDADGDGYSSGAATCVGNDAGYVDSSAGQDCYDSGTGASTAHPGQTTYQGNARGDGSFDYDCDGVETKNPALACVIYNTGCVAGTGSYKGAYAADEVPACGSSGSWFNVTVYANDTGCSGTISGTSTACTSLFNGRSASATYYGQKKMTCL